MRERQQHGNQQASISSLMLQISPASQAPLGLFIFSRPSENTLDERQNIPIRSAHVEAATPNAMLIIKSIFRFSVHYLSSVSLGPICPTLSLQILYTTFLSSVNMVLTSTFARVSFKADKNLVSSISFASGTSLV